MKQSIKAALMKKVVKEKGLSKADLWKLIDTDELRRRGHYLFKNATIDELIFALIKLEIEL